VSESVKILFIDDSEDDTLLMVHCLAGIYVDLEHQRVESKEELLDVLFEIDWDLIITDNAMPQLTGTEAINSIRKAGVKKPIICVSGSDIGNYSQDCLNAGALAFVLKDDLEKLREIVSKIINQKNTR
jgi:CheY-like chemotaxis protein